MIPDKRKKEIVAFSANFFLESNTGGRHIQAIVLFIVSKGEGSKRINLRLSQIFPVRKGAVNLLCLACH